MYVPCIGAHYTNTGLAGSFNPAAPSELLYDGTRPTRRSSGSATWCSTSTARPTGFAGPNDRWHQHNFNGGLCIGKGGVVVGAEKMSPKQCTRGRAARKVALDDIWMLHDWIVPGFECTWGVVRG